jgi:hypothetical protein
MTQGKSLHTLNPIYNTFDAACRDAAPAAHAAAGRLGAGALPHRLAPHRQHDRRRGGTRRRRPLESPPLQRPESRPLREPSAHWLRRSHLCCWRIGNGVTGAGTRSCRRRRAAQRDDTFGNSWTSAVWHPAAAGPSRSLCYSGHGCWRCGQGHCGGMDAASRARRAANNRQRAAAAAAAAGLAY